MHEVHRVSSVVNVVSSAVGRMTMAQMKTAAPRAVGKAHLVGWRDECKPKDARFGHQMSANAYVIIDLAVRHTRVLVEDEGVS
jgi:hypothetical protein